MFNKIKQLKQIKEIQDSLKKERIVVEREGISIIINGGMEVEEINLNPSLDVKIQEKILKSCINEAFKKVQFAAAQKMGIGF